MSTAASFQETLVGGRHRALTVVVAWRWALLLAALVGLMVGVGLVRGGATHRNSDMSSNYATARAIAIDGHPWLQLPAKTTDEYDVLHPRGFTTRDGRAVPIQPLPTAALHAVGRLTTGTYWVSAVLLAAVGVLGWVVCIRTLTAANVAVATASLVITFPLVYWLSTQYYTASTYLAVLPWAVTMLAIGLRRPSCIYTAVGGALHGLALSARPDFIFAHLILCAGLGVLVVSNRPRRQHLLALGAFGLGTGAVFSVIVLGTNYWLLGSPFAFGYDIARDQPGFDQPLDLNTTIPALDYAGRRLFPFGVADADVLLEISLRYLIQLPFMLAAFSLVGIIAFTRHHSRLTATIVLSCLIVLLTYIVVSRATTAVSGSDGPAPSVHDSVTRYFLPVYIIMAVFTAVCLSHGLRARVPLLRALTAVLAVVGSIVGILYVGYTFRQLMVLEDAMLERTQLLADHTEPSAVIVSPLYDKHATAADRFSLAWELKGPNRGFRPDEVAQTIAAVVSVHLPVYVLDSGEVRESFLEELCSRRLSLIAVEEQLYRVVEAQDCGERIDGLAAAARTEQDAHGITPLWVAESSQ